ncbi:MAG TPA: hypothetical protein VJA47_04480 [archaeon]|nr:hypothetical protein [archaeon]
MYKSGLFLVALVSAVLLLSISVNAQTSQIKSWYTLPTNLSADGPFIWVVETQDLGAGNRLSWQKYQGPVAAGSFNKIIPSKWVCFFSDDTSSTCGPTPFIQPVTYAKTGAFSGRIDVNGPSGSNETKEFGLDVGALNVRLPFKQVNGATIDASVTVDQFPGTANVTYRLFDSTNLNLVKGGQTVYRSGTGDYYVNLTLSSGKYYLVFDVAVPTGQKGGRATYFEIGGGSSILPPTQSGIDVGIAEIDATTVAGDTVDRQFVINNPTNTSYSNLSIVVPDKTKQYVTIELLSTSLQSSNSTEYTIKVRADKNIVIRDSFDLVETKNGITTVLKTVPLDIRVSITGGTTTQTTGDKPILDLDPLVITGINILTGNTSTQKLLVRNIGAGNLTLETPELEGFTADVVSVNQPTSVSSTPGEITITLRPSNPANYKGRVKIKSNGGVKPVYIDFTAYDDIYSELQKFRKDLGSYKGNLTKQGVSSSDADRFLSSAISKLDSAESDYDNKDYSEASQNFEQAKSEFALVKSILSSSSAPSKLPTPSADGGFPIWIIIVIVMVVAVILLVVIKKKKGKKKAEDDGYGEEGEYTEEEGGDEEYEEEK